PPCARHALLRPRPAAVPRARDERETAWSQPVTSGSPVAGRQSASVSVVIPTFNRAALLGETLDSLARLQPRSIQHWEVLVVDNNSTDGTAAVARGRQAAFPVPLRYEIEASQGRSTALNCGIVSACAPVLAVI